MEHQIDQPEPQQDPATSFAEAKDQLKEQVSSFLGFFKQVSKDIASSSEKMVKELPQNNRLNFMRIFETKTYEKKEDTKAEELLQTVLEYGNTEKDEKEVNENFEKEEEIEFQQPAAETTTTEVGLIPPNMQESQHTQDRNILTEVIENTNQARVVENDIEPIEPIEPVEPARPEYSSLGELFGSIKNFVSITSTNIEKSSSELVDKIKTDGWSSLLKPKVKPETVAEKVLEPEIKSKAKSMSVVVENYQLEEIKRQEVSPNRQRLEEVKRLKKSYENQLQSLSSELVFLEGLEKGVAVDNKETDQEKRSREEGQRRKRSFRITSDAHNKEKSADGSRASRPCKKLYPLNDYHRVDNRLSESGKSINGTPSEPLFMKLEKQFLQNVVFPELESRKEKLKAKREFYKPMDEKELREHAIKYEETVRKRSLEKKIERVRIDKEEYSKTDKPLKHYKSIAFQKAIEQEKEEKAKYERRTDEKKQLKDKQVKYGQLVKEMFFPKIERDDPISKQNIQDLIEKSLKAEQPIKSMSMKDNIGNREIRFKITRNKMSRDFSHQSLANYRYSPDKSRTSGMRDFTDVREISRQNNSPNTFLIEETSEANEQGKMEARVEMFYGSEEPVRRSYKTPSSKGIPKITNASPKRSDKSDKSRSPDDHIKVEQEVLKKVSYPNYLNDIRKKRIEQEKKGIKVKLERWEKHMKEKGVSHKERVLNILDDVSRIEHQVKLKEEKLKTMAQFKNVEPFDLEDQVGDMYLQSIKAKLAILKDI